MEQINIVQKVDLTRTFLGMKKGKEAWIPIDGFSVNTARSTASRLCAKGYGDFSIKEDYINKRLYITRR